MAIFILLLAVTSTVANLISFIGGIIVTISDALSTNAYPANAYPVIPATANRVVASNNVNVYVDLDPASDVSGREDVDANCGNDGSMTPAN